MAAPALSSTSLTAAPFSLRLPIHLHVPHSALLGLRKNFKLCQSLRNLSFGWRRNTKTCMCAQLTDTEKAFEGARELDWFIDDLRKTECEKLPEVVAKNILSFNTTFWMRLATRTDFCNSADDKKDYEDLASSIMNIIDCIVKTTEEKIESSTNALNSILLPITESDKEIMWPPHDPERILLMRQELQKKELEGYLDESFLSEVNAQIRKAKDDGDKPGLVAILQKVLQFYSIEVLSKQNYAVKDGQVDKYEEQLQALISADEENWERLLRESIIYGGGKIQPEELYTKINKRVEHILLHTEKGSYQQRILLEYLREIEARVKSVVEAYQASIEI